MDELSPNQEFHVEPATWVADEAALREVRLKVFVDEQKFPESEEFDDLDARSQHVLAYDADHKPIGCARLTPDRMIGRVAVLAPWRKRGVGEALLRTLLEQASALRYPDVSLHSQVAAIGFYERAGFVAEGEEFDELGVMHRLMRREVRGFERPPERPLPEMPAPEPLEAQTLSEAQACIDRVADDARHKLSIYTRGLDRDLLDRASLIAAIKRIALSGRGAEVRVIVQSPAESSHEGHRLLQLAAKLPSFVQLRTPMLDEDKQYPSAFVVNDAGGYFFRVLGSRFEGDGDRHAPGRNRELQNTFDPVWERSQEDPELRKMTI
jgi:predicted GNAT family N-acyltransferase